MSIFDEARSIHGMLKLRDMTQSQLAELLGVSQPYIANKVRLLKFSPEMQKRIEESGISERAARTILRLPEDRQSEVLEIVVAGKMNTAMCEEIVDRILEEYKEDEPVLYESFTDRLIRLEDIIEGQLRGFRLFGHGAGYTRESFGEKIYIRICIG